VVEDGRSSNPPTSETWSDFGRRHVGSPFLGHDPLYALTEPMIDAIKAVVPDFFTSEQEAFELDLARTASFGFFLGRALGSTAPATGSQTEPTPDERYARSSKAIRDMLADEMKREGRSYF
jgi:hypothetical protein